jgi:hypothetical protein
MALVFPTAAQALLQTPLNTFSPTSNPIQNLTNSVTYTYNTTLGVWTAAGAGGGSSVTAATLAEAAAGTLNTVYSSPQTSVPKDASGMAGAALIPGGNDAARPSPVTGMFRYNNQSGTPVRLEYYDGAAWSPVGSTAGLGLVLDGSALKVSLPVASTPPAVGGGVAQAVNGSMYWDDTLGQLFIRYINSGNPAWVAAAPPAGGSVSAASLAEAAAGTVSTKYSSPQTAVPKDASGMTGAAIIPSGTNAQRAAIAPLVVGMQRFNTDSGYEEVYTGATLGWRNLAYTTAAPSGLVDVTVPAGAQTLGQVVVCRNFTVNAGAIINTAGAGIQVVAYGNVVINASTWNFKGTGPLGGGSLSQTALIQTLNGSGYGAGGFGDYPGSPYSYSAQLGGSGGGSGLKAGGVLGINQDGGNGGGYISIKCFGNITFSGAITMDASGGDGNSAGGVGSGSGGGSGGCILLDAGGSLTIPATVTLNVAGGNGGTGNTVSGNTGAGGGGGGGGWVAISAASVAGAPTTNVSGGTGGGGSGVGVAAASGASCAGRGGKGGASNSAPAQVSGDNGGAGIVVYGPIL